MQLLEEVRRRAHDWWVSPRVQTIRLLPDVSRGTSALLAGAVLAGGLLPVVAIVASGPLVAAVPGVIHDGLASGSGRQALVALGVIGVAFAAGQSAGRVSGTLATLLGSRLDAHLQQRVIVAVNRPAGIRHLDDPAVQDLVSRVRGVGATGYTPGGAVQGLSARTAFWIQGAASAALLLPYKWWLAPLLVGVQLARARISRRDLLRQTEVLTQQTQLVRRSAYFRDLALTPDAAKELQLFGLASWVVDRFRAEWLTAMAQVWRERGRGGWQVTAVFGAAAAANFLAYGLLGWDAAQGALGLGALAVLLRGTHGIWNVASLGPQDSQIEYGVSAVPAVFELEAAVTSEPEDRGEARPDGVPATAITFEGVRFAYPGSTTVALRGVDLSVPAGRSLALVGANGAGKTTLVKLLCRLYDPDAGAISADGVDLRDLDPRAWQRNVAAIFQDFTRFQLPVRDNVAFGALQLSDDLGALEEAARRAGVLDRIRALPKGWDTPLARHLTDGGELSGGEWQRVALARALVAAGAGARVLVLDEPTANLDVRAEAAFYDRFLELTAGLTTILVSHRFSTVRRADLICVLEDGQVAELGTHDELVERDGSYARMFALQAAQFADEPA